jgi:hypothetical protein
VNALAMVSARRRLPSKSASETKSIDYMSLGAAAAGCRSGLVALTLRLGLLSGRLSLSSQ